MDVFLMRAKLINSGVSLTYVVEVTPICNPFLAFSLYDFPNNLAHDKPLRFERKTVHVDKAYTSL